MSGSTRSSGPPKWVQRMAFTGAARRGVTLLTRPVGRRLKIQANRGAARSTGATSRRLHNAEIPNYSRDLSGATRESRRRPMRLKLLVGLALPPALAVMLGMAAPAYAQADQPTLLGSYGDWGAYTATPSGKRVCFVLAKPKSSQTTPTGRKRDQAYLFISTRPSENVRHEVSVIIGYPFKENTEATAEIGQARFAMYTQKDGAWIKNVSEEARLLEAMRKGADVTVKGMSARGTQSTDQFSLKGLTQALERAEQECK